MKIGLINDWQYITSIKGFNNDLDLLNIHVEFGNKYLGFYFVLFGLGVEIVVIN